MYRARKLTDHAVFLLPAFVACSMQCYPGRKNAADEAMDRCVQTFAAWCRGAWSAIVGTYRIRELGDSTNCKTGGYTEEVTKPHRNACSLQNGNISWDQKLTVCILWSWDCLRNSNIVLRTRLRVWPARLQSLLISIPFERRTSSSVIVEWDGSGDNWIMSIRKSYCQVILYTSSVLKESWNQQYVPFRHSSSHTVRSIK